MRIIAGEYRGRAIEAPPGGGTRPTTDRMRESLMSRIASLRGSFVGASVLDAFAGSGALGLEALSRGAARCRFFERDRKALRCLRGNVARLGVDDGRTTITAGDVFSPAAFSARDHFDLVFLDPPYAEGGERVFALLKHWRELGILDPGAIVSYEYRRGDEQSVASQLAAIDLEPLSVRTFAQSSITLARLPIADG